LLWVHCVYGKRRMGIGRLEQVAKEEMMAIEDTIL
jgi:hypothetical protein